MKILKHILSAAALLVFSAACNHDPDSIVFAPTDLSIVSHSKVIVNDATADEDFTLVWNVRFASISEVGYTVEAALDENSEFVALGTTSVCLFTCKNSEIFDKLGVEVSGDYSFVFRVTAASAAGETKQATTVVAFSYDHNIYPETLGVTGDFGDIGWDMKASPQLWGDVETGKYWGYVSMYGLTYGFKFTYGDTWVAGVAVEDAENEFTLGTGDNMMIAEGLYRWDVDLDAMTAKATPLTKVGLIGDGVGGWDDDHAELVRDPEDGLYKAKGVVATDGTFKIRFNGDWDENLGGDAADLTIGGANIAITAGTYDFVLDLTHTPYKVTFTAAE